MSSPLNLKWLVEVSERIPATRAFHPAIACEVKRKAEEPEREEGSTEGKEAETEPVVGFGWIW